VDLEKQFEGMQEPLLCARGIVVLKRKKHRKNISPKPLADL
jgi:hypothetical protein